VRDNPGVRAVVLGGATDSGGAALVAAAAKGSGIDAGALVADGFALIQGGGKRNPDLTMAGGRNPAGVDEALAQARVAAGATAT
jgi:alanyl-tRNA synthetase